MSRRNSSFDTDDNTLRNIYSTLMLKPVICLQIENAFSSHMSALYKAGKLKVQIDSFHAGSIIVKFKIIIEDLEFPKELSAFDPMISSLYNSSVLVVDPTHSLVEGRLSHLMSSQH